MKRYIAFLRAINVGGRVVKMERLREIFMAAGLAQVETFIASGNVIFTTNARNVKVLNGKVETALHRELGYEVATFLRTETELAAVANYQPFAPEAIAAAQALSIGFLAAPLAADATQKLLSLSNELDEFHTHGREVYWLTRIRQSDSKFSNAVFEKMFAQKATWRTVNTVKKLAAKYPPGKA